MVRVAQLRRSLSFIAAVHAVNTNQVCFETAVYCVQSVTVNLELNRVKATNHGYDDGSDLAGSNPEAIPKGQQLTRFALMYRSFDHKAGR